MLIVNWKPTIVKKILSIVWYKVLPPAFGGQKGIAQFNKHLATFFPLVCICSRNNEPSGHIPYKVINELPVGKSQFFNPFSWKKIKKTAQQEQVSHILLEHPYHAIAASKAKKATGAYLILHAHNIESERFRQMGKWWWHLLYRLERRIHREADLVLFKTDADMEFAIQRFGIGRGKCRIIPYGIDPPTRNEEAGELIRQRHSILPEEKILLFAGTLDYTPNAKAVEAIFTMIAPALPKGYRIIICGRNHHPAFRHLRDLSHPMVVQAGEVSDIADYFSAADVFINPVLEGGGIQTKNIDALSYHCTSVCFAQQATGIPTGICGNKLLVAENGNWDNFMAMALKAAGIHEQTPELFFTYFDWRNILPGLVEHLSIDKNS